jgi:uroporphyrin-III C-methyltransferase
MTPARPFSIGSVSIVGAGPGDPELVTVRGLARIHTAEVLVYDRLVDPALVAEAPLTCERVFAGKEAGRATMSQRRIESLLINRARLGKRVVRLKGGDPFVFGRGGEELSALVEAGIPVEIVPGVTSATAVPGAAGIPVTYRGLSSAVTIVTGHEDPEKPDESVEWRWLAQASGTVVILMGLQRLDRICGRLIAEGRSPETPAAVVSAGTLPHQQVVTGDLASLPALAGAARLDSPALVVVGEVVRLAEMTGREPAADAGQPDPAKAVLTLLADVGYAVPH